MKETSNETLKNINAFLTSHPILNSILLTIITGVFVVLVNGNVSVTFLSPQKIIPLGITGFLWGMFTLSNISDFIFKLTAENTTVRISRVGPFMDEKSKTVCNVGYITYDVYGTTYENHISITESSSQSIERHVGKYVKIYYDPADPEKIVQGGSVAVIKFVILIPLTAVFILTILLCFTDLLNNVPWLTNHLR
ncbi:hypothetical protein FACS1894120_1470 [Clostridia bacterium]|nr:hypothetical protein FACS1894120_1470 [Clostridia bacterium]